MANDGVCGSHCREEQLELLAGEKEGEIARRRRERRGMRKEGRREESVIYGYDGATGASMI